MNLQVAHERLGAFLPGLNVPTAAYPSFTAGISVLVFSNFLSTCKGHTYTPLRLALAPISIWFFLDFGYGPYPSPSRGVDAGLATLALYGIMRVLESTVVDLLDEKPPRWIIDGKEVPIPATFSGRLTYAFDLTTSLRGNSWFSGTTWNWAPKSLLDSPARNMNRTQFLVTAAISLFRQYLLLDIIDTINKSRLWSSANPYPITSLPFHEQLIFATSVCLSTLLSITFPWTVVSFFSVLLGSHPSNWPPMFDSPFTATSLADFWSRRWHFIFRRVFERLSTAILRVLRVPHRAPFDNTSRVIRAIVVFGLSAIVHILLMHRVDISRDADRSRTFMNRLIIMFFLSQPLGLVTEAFIIIPFCKAFLPPQWKTIITRVWAWSFLLMTGRFWADVWVSSGFWEPNEQVVGYSLVRGGKWMI
jgi:hypothetical protein